MKQFAKLMTVVCATVAGIGVSFASAENVKVTPLGGQEGSSADWIRPWYLKIRTEPGFCMTPA